MFASQKLRNFSLEELLGWISNVKADWSVVRNLLGPKSYCWKGYFRGLNDEGPLGPLWAPSRPLGERGVPRMWDCDQCLLCDLLCDNPWQICLWSRSRNSQDKFLSDFLGNSGVRSKRLWCLLMVPGTEIPFRIQMRRKFRNSSFECQEVTLPSSSNFR